MSSEEWRPVVGWESRYEVSDLGRVRGIATQRGSREPRIIAPQLNVARGGYPQVRFYAGSIRRRAYVHTVVLAAFVGPRPDGAVTRHLNGDPADSRLANLTYGTQSQNISDQVTHGTHPFARRSACKHGHELDAANTYVTSKGARMCRTCTNERGRRYRLRRSGVAA